MPNAHSHTVVYDGEPHFCIIGEDPESLAAHAVSGMRDGGHNNFARVEDADGNSIKHIAPMPKKHRDAISRWRNRR